MGGERTWGWGRTPQQECGWWGGHRRQLTSSQLDPQTTKESPSFPIPSAACHFLGVLAWSVLEMWDLGKQPSLQGI